METVELISIMFIPAVILFVIIFGITRRVKVYDAFCTGAKEGLQLVINILPFICAMMVAISVFRTSGLLEKVSSLLAKPLSFLHIPPEIISLFLMRPFSGSASVSMLVDIFKSAGVNSLTADIASTMMGCTETTFYTLALYFGSVGIKKTRYALVVAGVCDVLSMLMSVMICRLLL